MGAKHPIVAKKQCVLEHQCADLCSMEIECIVNAANKSGLGCYIPNHCLDSKIHALAGPELLLACKKLNGIPTGVAKITPGFRLPAKNIIHCTGPSFDPGLHKSPDFVMLQRSYEACLNVAQENKISELAFCCLSTGIFQFPKAQSANVAINTVKGWLKTHPNTSLTKIVFVTFTLEDTAIYEALSSTF